MSAGSVELLTYMYGTSRFSHKFALNGLYAPSSPMSEGNLEPLALPYSRPYST